MAINSGWVYCGRRGLGGSCAFQPHRYFGKQTGKYNNKKDINEQRILNYSIDVEYTPEKTEMATKPEDGSWNVFYKGETAKLPLSIKNQTPEKLYAKADKGFKGMWEFITITGSRHGANPSDYKGRDTIEGCEYRYFNTSTPWIDHITVHDALEDLYPDTLADFYVVSLPISKEGEIYQSEKDDRYKHKWIFPNTIEYMLESSQINITVDGYTYSLTNPDNSFKDFCDFYDRNSVVRKSEKVVYVNNLVTTITQEDLEIYKNPNPWIITITDENGITYTNYPTNEQDRCTIELEEKYSTMSNGVMNSPWETLYDLYDMATEKGWKVTIKNNSECYSSENPDNSIFDFRQKYHFSLDEDYFRLETSKDLPEDFGFTFELVYNGRQIYKIDCHV